MPTPRSSAIAPLALVGLSPLFLSMQDSALAQAGAPRQRLSFNADWRFLKADAPNGKAHAPMATVQKWRWKSGQDLAALTADTSGRRLERFHWQ